MSSQNGAPAPSVIRRTTTFLPDISFGPWQGWLYALTRARWLGMALVRWLYLLLTVLAGGWLLWTLPGGWQISLGWLVVAAALWLLIRMTQRRHFSAFRTTPATLPAPASLAPGDKRAAYVTGALSVETKARTFTALPGFYRSFATREHVLIGRVQPRRIAGFATWPEDEIGLWYAFVTPSQIVAIAPGQQQIGRHWLPALALTYTPAPDAGKRRRTSGSATLYLAFPNLDDHAAVLADLLVERSPAPPSE